MRRILLIVAMLLLATAPAMAAVTIRAIQSQPNTAIGQYSVAGRDCRALDINYTWGSSTEEVRAFALEVTLDNGMVFTDVCDFNRGESNSVTKGYGIFPGSFRTALNPADINWRDPNYRPIASNNDPDGAGTGIGTNKVILEMGSLYVSDTDKPPSAGTLCRLWVDPNRGYDPNRGFMGVKDCNLGLAVNALRGGIVDKDGNPIAATIVRRGVVANDKFSFPKIFPCWDPYRVQYNEWLAVWEPRCWAAWQINDVNWRVQCWGDADNKAETASKYRVYNSDYTRLVASWAKKATLLRNNPDINVTLCADSDHKLETASKYRVYNSDYDRLVAAWAKKETVLRASPFGWCPLP